jgi:hypothetical protein
MHGARSDTGKLLRRYLGWEANRHSGAVSAESAALYAGAISAVHEIDDVHQDTSLHPGSVVVAAAMAAAVEADAQGSRLLAAVAIGYEVAVRLSIAAGHRHYHYFHATATCGAVGAVTAAATVFDLDEEATAHAIGMAATSASGLWEGINDEAVTIKHLHPGLAAERGVRAAKLARLGLRGARFSIEGDKGFLAALAQPGTQAPSRDDLVATSGAWERQSCAASSSAPFASGVRAARRVRHPVTPPRGERHRRVLVGTSPPTAWMVGQPDPRRIPGEIQRRCACLVPRAMTSSGAARRLLADPEVRRWIPVRVEGNQGAKPRARVTLTLKDGSCVRADQPFRNLDDASVWARFSCACTEYLGERGVILERRVDACSGLSGMTELMPLVNAAIGR